MLLPLSWQLPRVYWILPSSCVDPVIWVVAAFVSNNTLRFSYMRLHSALHLRGLAVWQQHVGNHQCEDPSRLTVGGVDDDAADAAGRGGNAADGAAGDEGGARPAGRHRGRAIRALGHQRARPASREACSILLPTCSTSFAMPSSHLSVHSALQMLIMLLISCLNPVRQAH